MSQITNMVVGAVKQEATARVVEHGSQAAGFLSGLSAGEALFLLILGLILGWIAYKVLAWLLRWVLILGLGAAGLYVLFKVATH